MDDYINIVTSCKTDELLEVTISFLDAVENVEDAEKFIRVLWTRVPELTNEQEKEIHKVGRKIRKKLNMPPVRI